MIVRSLKKPRYTRNILKLKRPTLHRNLPEILSTAWRQLLTFGTAGDFIVSLNFTKSVIMQTLLPVFDIERSNVNCWSPYGKCKYSTRLRSDIESFDIIGLTLCYLKSRDLKLVNVSDFRVSP